MQVIPVQGKLAIGRTCFEKFESGVNEGSSIALLWRHRADILDLVGLCKDLWGDENEACGDVHPVNPMDLSAKCLAFLIWN